jgi:hypothetical protein
MDSWTGGDKTTLSKLSCTNVYQRLEARAVGELSDGTSISGSSFYQHVEFNSSVASVAEFSAAPCSYATGLCRGLLPFSPGSILVTGKFGRLSTSLIVTVSSDSTALTALSVGDSVDGTLAGEVGTTATLVLTATFDDGTSMDVSNSGVYSSLWLNPSSLLVFNSIVPGAIGVSSEGVLTLYGNHFEVVSISARCLCCGGSVNASLDMFANLDPAIYDLDLGAETGAPFGHVVAVGGTFSVAVRVMGSSTFDVTEVSAVVSFDTSLVEMATCVPDTSGWSHYFECYDADDGLEIYAVCEEINADDCGALGLISLATVTFTALAPGTVEIGGTIGYIFDSDPNGQEHAVMEPIMAGAGELVVTTGLSRRLAGQNVAEYLNSDDVSLQAFVEEKKGATAAMATTRRTVSSTSLWSTLYDSIFAAVDAWCTDPASVAAAAGPIESWDTSSVVDMSRLFLADYRGGPRGSGGDEAEFQCGDTFNVDLSNWDVSSVVAFDAMFFGATAFQHDLCWDSFDGSDGLAFINGLKTAGNMFYGSGGGSVNKNAPKCACGAGTFYNGDTCSACPFGTYSYGKTDSCSVCPSGTALIASNDATQCLSAPSPSPSLRPSMAPSNSWQFPSSVPSNAPTSTPSLTPVPTPAFAWEGSCELSSE